MSGSLEPSAYPGERLGLPETGPGSVGRIGRRIGAYLIDAMCASVVSSAFFGAEAWATLAVFAAVQIVFVPTIGGSPGHRLVGMRVVLLGGGWVGLWRPIVRTALIVLLIPAVIWDSDQRGLHDKAIGTVLVRV
ncbi:MAG: RDD family protein [Microbacterium sp.]|uniref:RDD family protein n=1 Tax=Microbacterium sp. TaxID=51671 RepID=UPI0039E3574D